MEKIANKLGLMSLLVVFIALFLKMSHLPGASILLLISLGGGVPFFIIMYIVSSIKTGMNLSFIIVGGFSLELLSVGSLFKILHWPGANVLFYPGFIILAILLFIFSITSALKKEKPENAFRAIDYMILTVVVLAVGIQGMMPRSAEVVDFDRTFIETQTKSRQVTSDFELVLPALESERKAIVDQFIKQSEDIVQTTESIKMSLLEAAGVDEISQLNAKQLENRDITGQILILEQENNRLKATLDKHREFIVEHESIFMVADQAQLLLNTSDHIIPDYGEIVPWEYYMFEHKNVSLVFVILNEIESNALLLRYMALLNVRK